MSSRRRLFVEIRAQTVATRVTIIGKANLEKMAGLAWEAPVYNVYVPDVLRLSMRAGSMQKMTNTLVVVPPLAKITPMASIPTHPVPMKVAALWFRHPGQNLV